MPINVKDAANYIIRLFYENRRNCKSAVVQKLLVIAQMKSLRKLGQPLFMDDIIVKPLCFSIEHISQRYPIVIFECDGWKTEITELQDSPTAQIDEIESADLQEPSYFYRIVDEISEEYKSILRETYEIFGGYSGNLIGQCMRNMQLHSDFRINGKIGIAELTERINNLTPLGDLVPNEKKYANKLIDYINCDA